MYSGKYLIVMALLLFCLFCQQAVEAHFGHELHKAVHKVDKVASHINKAKHVIEAGGAIAGVIAGASAA